MKKFLSVILAFALIIGSAANLATLPVESLGVKASAEGSTDPDHVHDWGEWITKAPTCTEDGYDYRLCKTCEAREETNRVPATGHSFGDWFVSKAPTCTKPGYEKRVCANCGKSEKRLLKATGHDFGEWTVSKAPTCTEYGTKTRQCKNCGQSEYIKLLPLGHTWGPWTVDIEPTCDTTGSKTHTCEACGATETVDIPALGHKYGEWTVVKEPTCDQAGQKKRVCSVCGSIEYMDIAPLGHEYGQWVHVLDATCSKEGEDVRTCTVCGHTDVRYIEKLPHTRGADGFCTVCGELMAPATPEMVKLSNIESGVLVIWNAVPQTDRYEIYRRGAGETEWNKIGDATTAEYIDTNVETGKFYRYTVKAFNEKGESEMGDGIYTRFVATPNLVKISNAYGGVRVDWDKVPGATEYKIYRRGVGETTWTYLATVEGDDLTSYVDKTAKTGTYWRYTVRAVQMGRYSGLQSGLVTKYVATPKMKSLTNLNNGIKVEWNKVTGADEYRIYRRSAGHSWVYVTTVTGDNNTFLDTNATEGTFWRYTVRAVDDGRYSAHDGGIYIQRGDIKTK